MALITVTTSQLRDFLATPLGKASRSLIESAIRNGLIEVIPDTVPDTSYDIPFPSKGSTCLFVPRGQGGGNRTTWDPLEQPNMWKWLKALNANCVCMLGITSKGILTDDQFKDVASKCKANNLYPFWTMYVDGTMGNLNPKKKKNLKKNKMWRQNFTKDTLKLIQTLDRLKIPGAILFSIESNEVVSASEVTAWANECRKATNRKLGTHMQLPNTVPSGLDIVMIETNQPDKGDALSVDSFIKMAKDGIASVKAKNALAMVMEYNENVSGQRYMEQRAANSKLDQWGYG